MRILLLNYEFPPVGGGASAASYHTARELARRGHDVDVLTCAAPGHDAEEVVDGVRVFRVFSQRKASFDAGFVAALTYVWFARSKLRRLLSQNRYDLAHFYFAVPTGLLTFTWRKFSDAPYVVSLRGSDVPGYDPDARMINWIHALLKPVTRRILANAHRVLPNSDSLRRLAARSFPWQPMVTITNGVCTTTFAPPSNKPDASTSVNAVCVSRLVARKGISTLLEAIAATELPALRLTIVGSGPIREELETQARELGVDTVVSFIGGRNGDELVQCYKDADLLVHPTLTESFSMTLLEGMSCGLPVIASDVGGVPELVEDGVNGILVKPGDSQALAAALTEMTKSAELRQIISRRNRQKIIEKYSWDRIVSRFEAECLTGADQGGHAAADLQG